MSDSIRWGIPGTGSIAHKFATGLAILPTATLDAAGSRRRGAADVLGDEFDVPIGQAGCEALAADPGVDVVRAATAHVLHCEATAVMECICAGKLSSDNVSLDETLHLMNNAVTFRAQGGPVHPME